MKKLAFFFFVFFLLLVDCTIVEKTQLMNQEFGVTTPVSIDIPHNYFEGEDYLFLSTYGRPEWMNQTLQPFPLLGTTSDIGTVYDIDVRFPYAYILDQTAVPKGLVIYNITNPSSPTRMSNFTLVNPYHLIVEDGLAYICDWTPYRLVILDVSDPMNIVLLGESTSGLAYVFDLDKEGDIVYIADYTNGVVAYNVTDPTNPHYISIYASAAGARDVKVRNGTAYIAVASGARLEIADFTDPTTPVFVSSVGGLTQPIRIKLGDDFAYLGEWGYGVSIVDIHNITNPTIIERYVTKSVACSDVALGGPHNEFLVAAHGLGTTILDISDPQDIALVQEIPTSSGNAYAGVIALNKLYIGEFNGGGLRIHDMGSISLQGIPPLEDCGEDFLIQVVVDSNNGDQLNTTFEVSVRGTGIGNIKEENCTLFVCESVLSNETSDVCHGQGNCTFSSDISGWCECDPNYFGRFCGVKTCFEILSNSSKVCSDSHGICEDFNLCKCNPEYFGQECNITTCYGKWSNETNENGTYKDSCFGHGRCETYDTCECEVNYYGSECNITHCNQKWNNETTNDVCNNRGSCTDFDTCRCDMNYYGADCNITHCNQKWNNATTDLPCSNHGSCTEVNTCHCDMFYFGASCNITFCNEKWNNVTGNNLCNNRGVCTEHDNCHCDKFYYGENCNITFCNQKWNNDTGNDLCNNRGTCTEFDTCHCDKNYFGTDCNITHCNQIWNNDTTDHPCSNHGSCTEVNTCHCDKFYYGDECNITTCYTQWNNETDYCYNHGSCDSYNDCQCTGIYSGKDCSFFKIYQNKPIPNQVIKIADQSIVNIEIPIDTFHGDDFIFISNLIGGPSWINQTDLPPTKIGSDVQLSETTVYDIAIQRPYAYLSIWGSKQGLAVVDIQNTSNPFLVSRFPTESEPRNILLLPDNDQVLILGALDRFYILNISNSSSVSLINKTDILGSSFSPYGMDTDGDTLYIPDYYFGVRSFDISDLSNPQNFGDYATTTGPRGIKVKNDIGFLVSQRNSPDVGFQILNFSDSVTSPVVVGESTECYWPLHIEMLEDEELVILSEFHPGLRIFSINDLSNPIFHSLVSLPCGSSMNRIGGPHNNYVFSTGQSANCPNRHASIVDISNSTSPKEIFKIPNVTSGKQYAIQVSKNNILIGEQDGGLNIYEFGSINLQGTTSPSDCGRTFDIKVVVENNAGDSFNSSFSIFVSGEGYGNTVGNNCSVYTCDSILSNDTNNVCHGRGTCGFSMNPKGECDCVWPWNNASFCGECEEGYFGPECKVTQCGGTWSNDTKGVCSSHGICWPREVCGCEKDYFGSTCNIWSCGGMFTNSSLSQLLCSGHGICEDHESCECINLYSGDNCEFWSCKNTSSKDVNTVCAAHGYCIARDICACRTGYSSSSGVYGDVCDFWKCGEFSKDDPKACNERGWCKEYDQCECDVGYSGKLCQEWGCGEFEMRDSGVCSGNGICELPNDCVCESGWTGDNCETNIYLLTVMTPILATGGLVGMCFLLCFIIIGSIVVAGLIVVGACCMFVCIFVFFCCLVVCFVCCLSVLLCTQRNRLKKFGKLKNFDILMKEQEIEEDDTVAHLKFNKTLFEIDFEDIETVSILGEGGSSSMVYKCKWSGRICAFKCFKTRTLCTNQDSFSEFEREVELLSSISHPNIIQFYGACLNPPRVGIVMEICPNGELLEFVVRFRNTNDIGYPIMEKIRLLSGVASALEFLHARNIIHRDLKCENVLISKDENSKLMDFGLSRLVDSMDVAKTTRIGTAFYMAPEIVKSQIYDELVDVFSFGIMMYVLITENHSPYGPDSQHVELKVANDPTLRPNLEELEACVTKEDYGWISKICTTCWDVDTKKRYSCKKIRGILERRGSLAGTTTTETSSEKQETIKDLKESKVVEVQDVVTKEDVEELRKEIKGLLKRNEKLEKELEFYKQREEDVVEKSKEEEDRSSSENSSETESDRKKRIIAVFKNVEIE